MEAHVFQKEVTMKDVQQHHNALKTGSYIVQMDFVLNLPLNHKIFFY